MAFMQDCPMVKGSCGHQNIWDRGRSQMSNPVFLKRCSQTYSLHPSFRDFRHFSLPMPQRLLKRRGQAKVMSAGKEREKGEHLHEGRKPRLAPKQVPRGHNQSNPVDVGDEAVGENGAGSELHQLLLVQPRILHDMTSFRLINHRGDGRGHDRVQRA